MKFLLLIGSLFFYFFSNAQKSNISAYAYKQAVNAGVPPKIESDEKAEALKSPPRILYNYFIYLSYPKQRKVKPVEIWISAEPYAVSFEGVSTPVQLTYEKEPRELEVITLLHKTAKRVIRIYPIEKIRSNFTLKKNELTSFNEVVVVYNWKNKLYTATLKNIKSLPAVALP